MHLKHRCPSTIAERFIHPSHSLVTRHQILAVPGSSYLLCTVRWKTHTHTRARTHAHTHARRVRTFVKYRNNTFRIKNRTFRETALKTPSVEIFCKLKNYDLKRSFDMR